MTFGQQMNRIPPLGQPGDYVTYGIRAGRDTGVVAACKDVGCQAWAHGWQTTVDERTELGRAQGAYIRHKSGRTFTEHRAYTEESGSTDLPDAAFEKLAIPVPGLTVFRFEAFQRCFAEHRTNPDVFSVRDGDWRGNPTQRRRVHVNGMDWIEDLIEHEGGLADLRQKG